MMSSRPQPVQRSKFETIKWLPRQKKSRLILDPELESLYERNVTVYRYASLTEALSLFDQGSWQFKRPSAWRDPYEQHVGSRLFDKSGPFSKIDAFAKCFSLEFQSEAMWRLYAQPEGLVRLSFCLRDVLHAVEQATHPNGATPKVYVGRARYMTPPALRRAVDELVIGKPKMVSRLAMPAVLMKRDGFMFENEIRVCFSAGSLTTDPRTDNLRVNTTRTVSGLSKEIVTHVLLDPYASKPVAASWTRLLKESCGLACDVTQSKFDLYPDHAADA
jgi:hypothetical protein